MDQAIKIACAFLLGYALADYKAERKAKAHPAPTQTNIRTDEAAPIAGAPLAAKPTTKRSA